MKALGLFLGVVSATLLLALQAPGQPASQPAESREAAARARGGGRGLPPATAPAKLIWRGLDLSAAPVSTDTSQLVDIWEARPPGSKSYEVRSDVAVIRVRDDPLTAIMIYWLPSANRFYVQHDSGFSSTHHFYGPFQGDPNQVLAPPTSRPAGQ